MLNKGNGLMLKQVLIHVYGLVQGVALRWMVQEKSQTLNLTGYVKNLNDGTVKIIAVGSEPNLKELIRWLKSSPGSSQVADLKIGWEKESETYQDFKILF